MLLCTCFICWKSIPPHTHKRRQTQTNWTNGETANSHQRLLDVLWHGVSETVVWHVTVASLSRHFSHTQSFWRLLIIPDFAHLFVSLSIAKLFYDVISYQRVVNWPLNQRLLFMCNFIETNLVFYCADIIYPNSSSAKPLNPRQCKKILRKSSPCFSPVLMEFYLQSAVLDWIEISTWMLEKMISLKVVRFMALTQKNQNYALISRKNFSLLSLRYKFFKTAAFMLFSLHLHAGHFGCCFQLCLSEAWWTLLQCIMIRNCKGRKEKITDH